MAHDLVIKNGTLIDGSGAEPIRADVIVNDGRITGIGDSGQEKVEQVLDATGRIVTPGFIDAHTHLDAQVGWDPALTPYLPWHYDRPCRKLRCYLRASFAG